MIFWVLSISSLVVIVDRLTKYLLLKNLSEGESIRVIPGILNITVVLNNGAAFGLFKGSGIALIIFSVVVIALIIVCMRRSFCKDTLMITALGLIMGGAIGNLIDRVAFGYVVDFLDLHIWPVFNIADASITIGAIIIASRIVFNKRCCTI